MLATCIESVWTVRETVAASGRGTPRACYPAPIPVLPRRPSSRAKLSPMPPSIRSWPVPAADLRAHGSSMAAIDRTYGQGRLRTSVRAP